MTTHERHQRLIDAMASRRFLNLEDAITLTGASLATVRRDFASLARSGAVQRFWGGIRLPQTDSMLPFALRDHLYSEEKHGLAKRAITLLKAGDVVFIDGGTTTAHLATCLPDIPLRVITNSIRLAAMLEDRARPAGLEIFVTGGILYPKSGLLVGASATAYVSQYRAHWAFLSVGGLHADGLFNTNEQVVETERKMIENAEKVVVLADQSKLNRQAMCRLCGLDEIDFLIARRSEALDRLSGPLQKAAVRVLDDEPDRRAPTR